MEAGEHIDFLERMASGVDLRAALAEVAPPILHADETRRFETDTTADGVPWAHLAASTVLAKGHDTILEDTGAMRAAATSDAPGNIAVAGGEATDATFEYGVEAVHDGVPWVVHQFGTDRAGRGHNVHIPARPFIGASDGAIDAIAEGLADHEQKRWEGGA